MVQDKPFDENTDIKIIRTDQMHPSYRDQIQRYLYDTRAALYQPYASVCGRSFSTFRKFAEMVKKNDGRLFVNVMEDCQKILDNSRKQRLEKENSTK